MGGDFERARSALSVLAPSSHEYRVRIALALKDGLSDDGFSLWNDWYQQHPRYDSHEARDVWKSCRPGAIGFGTLFYEARKAGWTGGMTKRMSKEEYADRRRAKAAEQYQQHVEREQLILAGREKATQEWETLDLVNFSHAYLVRKRIQDIPQHEIRQKGSALVVPVWDECGIRSLQYIYPDGRKSFLPGVPVGGCWHPLVCFRRGAPTLIAEGFATGATGFIATANPVMIAFSAGNLLHVARMCRRRDPDGELVILGDDDHLTKGNPGRTKAYAAAKEVGARLVFPVFGQARPDSATDFNDMHVLYGLDEVTYHIDKVLRYGRGSDR